MTNHAMTIPATTTLETKLITVATAMPGPLLLLIWLQLSGILTNAQPALVE